MSVQEQLTVDERNRWQRRQIYLLTSNYTQILSYQEKQVPVGGSRLSLRAVNFYPLFLHHPYNGFRCDPK